MCLFRRLRRCRPETVRNKCRYITFRNLCASNITISLFVLVNKSFGSLVLSFENSTSEVCGLLFLIC